MSVSIFLRKAHTVAKRKFEAAIGRSDQMSKLRAQFSANSLNPTCAGCEMYRTLKLYRTPEGRTPAEINRARAASQSVKRENISGRWQRS
jgi:hypothetical protein